MNDGVAMLLERMKTHPEEFLFADKFAGKGNKWAYLVEYYTPYLTKEDQELLQEGIRAVHQQNFTEKVMEELVDPKRESALRQLQQAAAKNMPSAGATQGAYTLNSNGGVVSWEAREPLSDALDSHKYQTQAVKAHLDVHLQALKEEAKKSKTLFGKLFNYQ